MAVEARFYFDLASPLAYVAAEQVIALLRIPCEWQPVQASRMAAAESFEAYRCATEQDVARENVERRARAAHLQPFRWPEPFPFDSERAMLAATYAKQIGKGVAFAQAAFRQAFAGGHALADEEYVLLAAAACEMHPRAVLRALESRGVRAALDRATADAIAAGVGDVPAVRLGDAVFAGEDCLEAAAGALAR